jgi:tyrosinase
MKVHERLIREECNYRGVLPYWDQQADLAAAPLSESSIWDAKTGFGGPVTDSNNCVIDGPFVNITNNLRVDLSRGPAQCLTRKLSQTQFNLVSQAKVDLCSASKAYDEFNTCIGGDVHVAGHYTAGGIMDDVSLSPADPLFFMHHTNLDRIWWKWQSEDLKARLTDIAGLNVAPIPFLAQAQPPSLPAAAFFPYFGDNGGNETTLNHNLWMAGTMPNVTIADVMDIRGETICTEYV